MGRGVPALIGAALVATLALGIPSAASAACYSSTPSTARFSDAIGDGEAGLAPEITGVVAVTDDTCGIGIAVALSGAVSPGDLIEGEAVGIYLDTDGNPATGSPTWDGADRVVMIVGRTGPDLPPAVGVWDGAEFSFAGARELTPSTAAGFVAHLDELGVAAPATLGISTGAIWTGAYDTYADFAPEPGASPFAFPVQFSTTPPPPPPPPPAVAPPSSSPQDDSGSRRARRCKVPRLKGLTRSQAVKRLRRAECKYRFVTTKRGRRPGRVVSTSPPAGRRTAGRVTVRITARRRARASQVRVVTRIERLLSAAKAR